MYFVKICIPFNTRELHVASQLVHKFSCLVEDVYFSLKCVSLGDYFFISGIPSSIISDFSVSNRQVTPMKETLTASPKNWRSITV